MRPGAIVFIAVLSSTAAVSSQIASARLPMTPHQSEIEQTPSLPGAVERATTERATVSTLRIGNVRLEHVAHAGLTAPSSMLKFDMFNESSGTLRDPVLEISIVEKRNAEDTIALPRMLAGPYTIKTNVILNAGFSISYEIMLRNLAPDCDCV